MRIALADRYAFQRELGRGGMATVWLAHDVRHDRDVALKVLHPHIALFVGAERFLREIQITSRLQHPHILPLHDSGEAAGLLYYVMPFVDGETLRTRLERDGPVTEALGRRVAGDVAEALAYAHRNGVIHRDIKPENILLSGEHAVVADFGIARALSSTATALTESGHGIGTLAYMSPEQLSGDRELDGRSDIYSLGCVMFEMFAGRRWLGAPDSLEAHAAGNRLIRVRTSPLSRSVPATLAPIIRRALCPSPQGRFDSADQLVDALRRTASRSKNGLISRVLGGVAVAMAAGVVGLTLQSLRPERGLESNLIAVAPFAVLEPSLALWREGVVEVISRNLDGAGPFRSVPATTVLRQWRDEDRSDPVGATRLATGTGARYVVVGSVLPSGPGTTLLTTSIIDGETSTVLEGSEHSYRGPTERLDALLDSASVGVLEALGHLNTGGRLRFTFLGGADLIAAKAFLQGEQSFRRGHWDSAMVAYRRAVERDSTFSLALRRMGQTLSWQRDVLDSTSRELLARAARFNYGLGEHDSLLVAADGIRATLSSFEADTGYYAGVRRLFATLDIARTRYPHDAEILYALGDALFHFAYGPGLTRDEQEIQSVIEEAIRADSMFAPAYLHAAELAFTLDGAHQGRSRAAAYLKRAPTGPAADAMHVVNEVTLYGRTPDDRLRALLDTVSSEALFLAWQTLRRSPDVPEAAIKVIMLPQSGRTGAGEWFTDPAWRQRLGALQLAYGGRLDAALAYGASSITSDLSLLLELWLLGGNVGQHTASAIRGFEVSRGRPPPIALPWYAAHADTAAIWQVGLRSDSLVAHAGNPALRRDAMYRASSAAAYLALARGDSARASDLFTRLPDTLCMICYVDRLQAGRLALALGRPEEAYAKLGERLQILMPVLEPAFLASRAVAAERIDSLEVARRATGRVAGIWRTADGRLIPKK